MENFEKHPLHLKTPELHKSEEVSRAVTRQEERRGDKLPNEPTAKIEAYMSRLENIFLNPDQRVRQRNLELYRDKIYDALIIKPENFPESYFELQKKVARERGQAIEEIPQDVREQMIAVAIQDQKASLDAWIDYLSSDDAVYPPWFKYYAWNNIIKLSQFDKERGEFKKRTKSTVAPFPDIYREPLAQMADLYEQVRQDNKALSDEELQAQFSQKFPSLYAELIQKSLSSQIENKEEIKGEWIKYDQGDSGAAEKLFKSLENKGTGWCTAGQSTARQQVKSGDFYVYYTDDTDGNRTQPRLAIRMNGTNKIGEIRGVLQHQNVEPIMQEVLDEKLRSFGLEADTYRKKTSDMKRLTEIEVKTQKGKPLTREDLMFLYEINSSIDGFGYQKDPRIKELLNGRNILSDMPIVFECESNQIIHNEEEIKESIKNKVEVKVYIGQIFPNIFKELPPSLEHIYTKFPEGKIQKMEAVIGGQSKKALIREMKDNFKVSDYASDMMNSLDFTVLPNPEKIDLVRLKVGDLGFSSDATTDEIYSRAEELGLELCPAETGPQLRKQYLNQPMDDVRLRIATKQIMVHQSFPDIFNLRKDSGGLWLDGGYWAWPTRRWSADSEFVFRSSKSA